MYQRGVSGMRNMQMRKGTGMQPPSMASVFHSRYFPMTKQSRMPALPSVVGISPSMPRTSGCTVSLRYTGSDREAMPTQKPMMARPPRIMATLLASAIRNQAAERERETPRLLSHVHVPLHTCTLHTRGHSSRHRCL